MEIDHYTKNIEDWRKASQISAKALEFGKKLIKIGASAKEICDAVDKKVYELGGRPAFPAQISFNDTAAHNCPDFDDNYILKEDVVKLDIGAEYNGAIGDNACTVDLTGKYQDLVDASREALNNAISIIKPGLKINEIGKMISKTIIKKGFVPVSNLSGHGLDYNSIHCSPSIPNYDNGNENTLKEGMVFAVEPFASSGAGKIYESGEATIFMLTHMRGVRNPVERLILKEIEKYEGRPFASRWLCEKFSPVKVKFALKSLMRQEIIRGFPPLPDVDKGMVSQAEHTILVTKDGCEVLTKSSL